MPRFSSGTTRKLKAAGWKTTRLTDISAFVEEVTLAGCRLTPAMNNFLLEFQGLHLQYANGEELFDFTAHPHCVSKERCTLLASLLGEANVLNVGVMGNSNFSVVITDTNKMYALTSGEHDIFEIGLSFDEGIEFICTFGLKPDLKHLHAKRSH